jgi:EAL domain-containing protein (putative c-di-GMP-specific phosphodiesterase class I)
MRTTAEGIETEEQRAWLVAQNCSEGQGYLFGRPMSAKDLANFMNFEQADACRA